MNWAEIEKKYPKAWDKLFEMFDEGILENEILFENEPIYISDIIRYEKHIPLLFSRTLYDFFDEQGVDVEIRIEGTQDFEGGRASYGYVKKSNKKIWKQVAIEPTRTKAEEKAFERAFGILNNMEAKNE